MVRVWVVNHHQLLPCQILSQYFVLSEYVLWFRRYFGNRHTQKCTYTQTQTKRWLFRHLRGQQIFDYQFQKLELTSRSLTSTENYSQQASCTWNLHMIMIEISDTVSVYSHNFTHDKSAFVTLVFTALPSFLLVTVQACKYELGSHQRVHLWRHPHSQWGRKTLLDFKCEVNWWPQRKEGKWNMDEQRYFQYFCSTNIFLYPFDQTNKNHWSTKPLTFVSHYGIGCLK